MRQPLLLKQHAAYPAPTPPGLQVSLSSASPWHVHSRLIVAQFELRQPRRQILRARPFTPHASWQS